MSDLIDRQMVMNAFAERVKWSNNSDFAPVPRWNDAVEIVENLPSADAVEVRHGHWTLWEGDITFWLKCSECGKDVLPTYPHFYFCPHCGARMNGEKNDKE